MSNRNMKAGGNRGNNYRDKSRDWEERKGGNEDRGRGGRGGF